MRTTVLKPVRWSSRRSGSCYTRGPITAGASTCSNLLSYGRNCEGLQIGKSGTIPAPILSYEREWRRCGEANDEHGRGKQYI